MVPLRFGLNHLTKPLANRDPELDRWSDGSPNSRIVAGWTQGQKHEGPETLIEFGAGAFSWLRGLDLNQRPLGYEGNPAHNANQDEPSQAENPAFHAGRPNETSIVSAWFIHTSFTAMAKRYERRR
jgi:hypothetical protein